MHAPCFPFLQLRTARKHMRAAQGDSKQVAEINALLTGTTGSVAEDGKSVNSLYLALLQDSESKTFSL